MIRLARAGDARGIVAIYAPIVRDTVISFETRVPTVEEMAGRVEKTLATHPWLVEERDGQVVGYAYATQHRAREAYQWSVDVSCYVHPDARGQGIGAALYRALLGVLRKQGYHCAYAGIALPNPASVRLHESVGFTPVGIYRESGYKLGAWRDTGWWQRRLGEAPPDPDPPTPLAQLGLGVLDQL